MQDLKQDQRSEAARASVLREPPVSFIKAAAWTALIAALMTGTSILTRRVLTDSHVSSEAVSIFAGFAAAMAALIAALIIERSQSRSSLSATFRGLGFKSANRVQLQLALWGMAPILGGYLLIFFGLGKSPALEATAPLMIVKFVFSQGIAEEVVFRGLIFARLRKGRSFWRAASLSAVLFALIHLVNLIKGVSPDVVIAVVTSVVFGFILTFPLALLFEVGGFSMLGGAALHLAIDSVNWFREAGDAGAPMTFYLGSVLISAALVAFIGAKRIRSPSCKVPPTKPSAKPSASSCSKRRATRRCT